MNKIIFLIFLFLPFFNCLSYSPETTHAGLTEESLRFYVKYFNNGSFSHSDIENIMKGSIEEDKPGIRCLNHFYDPTRDIGINDFRTAKDWATRSDFGNSYYWGRCVEHYAKGDGQLAYECLGHILHLIQDMAVPDHTRNDPHMGDGPVGLFTGESSYESWADFNKDRNSLMGHSSSYSEKPLYFYELSDFFDFLANYSNGNFFGDDSVFGKTNVYEEPKIIENDGRYGYGIDSLTGDKFKLVKIAFDKNGKEKLFLSDKNDQSVMVGYFERLGKQAILGSAGVVELFLREGETAKLLLKEERERLLATETQKAKQFLEDTSDYGSLRLSLLGLSSLIKEKIIEPPILMFNSLGEKAKDGIQVAYSLGKDISPFVVYTIKSTSDNIAGFIKETASSAYASIKKMGGNAFSLNSASLSNHSEEKILDLNKTEETSLSKIDEKIEDNFTHVEIVIKKVETETPDKQKLLSILDSLYKDLIAINAGEEKIIEREPVSRIVQSQPYSPGFGGDGGVPILILTPENHQNSDDNLNIPNLSTIYPQLENEGSTFVRDDSVDNLGTSSLDDSIKQTEEVDSPDLSNNEEVDGLEFSNNDEISGEEGLESDFSTTTDQITENTEIEETENPPQVFLKVLECENSLSPDVCLVTTTTLNVFWSSDKEDLTYYLDINGVSTTTLATSTIERVEDNSSLDISIYAVDKNGNSSESVSTLIEIYSSPVVINEVAWGGTKNNPENEWIELYNKTKRKIDLSNWLLYSKTDNSLNIKLSGYIEAEDYYIIERKNTDESDDLMQSSIKDVSVDLGTSFGDGLSNSGEWLVLSLGSTTIDELPYCYLWCGVSSSRTTERIDPFEKGNISSNWASNNSEIINGRNVEGYLIYGTPGKRNSLNYLISRSGALHKDIVLFKHKSPYFVPKNSSLGVGQGVTLTIEPGVVIKFAEGGRFLTEGTINAKGTDEDPIVFTSFKDVEYGGDLKNGLICETEETTTYINCPKPGDWQGLIFNSNSIFKGNNIIVRYGGIPTGNRRAMVDVDNATVEIENSLFERSGTDGMSIRNSSGFLKRNVFSGNVASKSSLGLKNTGGNVQISSNYFKLNSNGLSSFSSESDIYENRFGENQQSAFKINGPIRGEVLGNFSDMNTKDEKSAIVLSGQITALGDNKTLIRNPMPYFISGSIQISASSTLSVGEGSVFYGSNIGTVSKVFVYGGLILSGTEDFPIIFSSNQDNAPKNYWAGINMEKDSSSLFDWVIIKDAGTAITYNSSPININNVSFFNNDIAIKASGIREIVNKNNIIFGDDNKATTSPKGLW